MELISVVIPLYNGERYLAQALESILAQQYRPLEIIVIDDGSTDQGAKIAQSYHQAHLGDPQLQIHYHYQANAGVGQARNCGVELAGGEYLAFLDQDDLWVPNKLALQIPALMSDPNLDMIFGHVAHFYSPDLDTQTRAQLSHPGRLMPGYHQGAMLMRRATFHEVGLFKTDGQFGHFLDWYARAQDKNLVMQMLPEVVMMRRIHTANTSTKEKANRTEYARVLGDALRRRRQMKVGSP